MEKEPIILSRIFVHGRCKECEHHIEEYYRICNKLNQYTYNDFYCAFFENKKLLDLDIKDIEILNDLNSGE